MNSETKKPLNSSPYPEIYSSEKNIQQSGGLSVPIKNANNASNSNANNPFLPSTLNKSSTLSSNSQSDPYQNWRIWILVDYFRDFFITK